MKQQINLGEARILSAKTVEAGSFTTVRYRYTCEHPIDDSGYIKIAFRFAGDFGALQFNDPTAPNYTTITTSGDCRIKPRWDNKGHTRPWGWSVYLMIGGGYLDRGDTVDLTIGDTREGSSGWQVQTFCESTFEFKTLVDPIATYRFKELPVSPTLRVVAGPPAQASCIAPSQVTVRTPFDYYLKLEDRWGNPTGKPKRLRHAGIARTGITRLKARDRKTRLSAVSNPVGVTRARADLMPLWADFHGQSEETIGSNTIEEYFAFARDKGLLDIAAHQGNDFQITDEFWKKINRVTRKFNRSGSFVTFPGYEWSANTPLGGDRNIYFVREGGEIIHSSTDLLPDEETACGISPTADKLYRALRQQQVDSFAFAHVGGRYPDMAMHDPKIEVAMEIHSAWGTFEWLVTDALARGYRIGICANSDGHKGRPGASYPGARKFGSLGGLTCVLARKLDRKSIVAAMQQRHFFATTGHRPIIDLRVTTASGRQAMMGDVLRAGKGASVLKVDLAGTAPIESVQVLNGQTLIKEFRPCASKDLGRRLKVVWSGAEVRGRARHVQWDGSLQLTGNRIEHVTPVNFHNPESKPVQTGNGQVSWKSITTGGLAGMILTLARPLAGRLDVVTMQKKLSIAVKSLGLKPRRYACGGVEKEIRLYRLPDRQTSMEYSFELPLTKLQKGDNPIYIRVEQEDGHLAWSSPVFLDK